MNSNNLLEEYRNKIDEIDNQILDLLAKRLSVVQEIGEYKKKHNMSSLQKSRREQVLQTKIDKGLEKGLSKDFVRNIREQIHNEALRLQE